MKTLAILVGGGPAPGINAVIAAATIEARNHGLRVLGCYDGFKWLVQGDTEHVSELEINDTSRIHFDGGSIIRTSRTNPTRTPGGIRHKKAIAFRIRPPLAKPKSDGRRLAQASTSQPALLSARAPKGEGV